MPNPPNITNITPPRVAIIDERTGAVSREWYRFFYNLFYATGGLNAGAIPPGRGGTGTTQTPTDGTLLIGNGTTGVYNATQLGVGPGIAKTEGPGSLSIENTGVLSFSGGSTGLTPATPTNGDVVLDGVLEVANGGTGADNPTDARINLEAAKWQDNSDITSMSGLTGGIASPIYIDMGNGNAVTLVAGRMWYSPATGAWNLGMGGGNITQQVGEEFFRYGKASADISDTNLQLVYKTGVVGASGVITFAPTVAGITDPDQILGIATESIATNSFGRVTTMGIVRGINTTGSVYGEVWADNDDIWYNPVTGGLTKTKPSAPNIKLQIGTVINAGSGGSGSFNVKLGSTSALGGTDSNVQLGTLANNDLLQYYSAGGYWRNVAASAIAIGTATNLAGGAANRIAYQTGANTTGFIVAPTVANTYLEWSGSAFQWSANPLGTVTSVGLALPTEFTVTNSPVTTSGTLTGTWASQTAKYFFAAPNASSGTPSFRAIVASDIPTLNQDTTGTAAKADTIKTVSTATNANYYLTFVDSDNAVAGYEAVYTDAGITYNPSTNSITSGISGGTF